MHNRILTDRDRNKFNPIIQNMFKEVPDMMKRKIPRANVQQAFTVTEIMSRYKPGDLILCVGTYEDTGYEYLLTQGYVVDGMSPEVNGMDLHIYMLQTDKQYDLIFSTSVMEHVEDDEQFINDICKLLVPNGTAILTVDFYDRWTNKVAKPNMNYRLYTLKDYARFTKIMEQHNCFFVDEFTVDSEPDFDYDNCKYNFATMVFKKLE